MRTTLSIITAPFLNSFGPPKQYISPVPIIVSYLKLDAKELVMYKILEVEDIVRVPPSKFRLKAEEAMKSSLEDRWEGMMERSAGIILSVVSVEGVGEGKIIPGDGAIYYPVRFSVLSYSPDMYEIVKGSVIDVTEFGVFIRSGPLDGMIHVSQIMDDFVSYDAKNSVFSGRDSGRILKEGDTVRARIISISMGRETKYKIGLTTRQPGLGVLGWAERKAKSAPAKKEQGKKGARTAAK
jgi:DNA-directed RNA polymerase subunit E'